MVCGLTRAYAAASFTVIHGEAVMPLDGTPHGPVRLSVRSASAEASLELNPRQRHQRLKVQAGAFLDDYRSQQTSSVEFRFNV
jgi:hypothetical protein